MASDSTISTASAVPATTRSRDEFLHLLDRRIELQLPADMADARRGDRPHEGNARQRQRRRSADHSEHVRLVLEIVRQHGDDHLRLVAIAFREERADRAVDQPRDQRLALRRASLALEIAAGDAARGKRLFLVIDGQREKVLAGLRRLGADDGGEQRGLAPGGEDRAVGLAGDLAGFEHELAAGPIEFFAMDLKHVCLSSI